MIRYKFEEIMEYYPYENYQSFLRLFDWIKTKKEDIFCYVGTGLSFYFKSWGEPFNDIITNSLINFISENQKASFLKDIENGLYLETGQTLDSIIRENTQLDDKSRTFNQYFLEVLNNKQRTIHGESNDAKNIKNGHLPEETIFFIPFIGVGNCITTNCDDSIEIAFRSAKKNYYSYIGENTIQQESWERNIANVTHIFYIHGRYDRAETLIMIKSDYNRVYGTPQNPAQSFNVQFLQNVAETKHILFLGASLEGDITYEIMKKNIRQNSFGAGEHIAFFKRRPFDRMSQERIDNERREMQNKMNELTQGLSTRPLFVPSFSCYTVVLCEAIREAESPYWNQESCSCEQCNRGEIYIDLERMMQRDTPFERYDAPLPLHKKKINRTLRPFLYDGPYRKPGWTICRVNLNEFTFPANKPFNPQNYNAPLGNTIYIIGGDGMYHDKVECLVKKIEKWTRSHQRDFHGGVKVRVIVYNSSLSPAEINSPERLENRILKEEYIGLKLMKGEAQIDETIDDIQKLQVQSNSLRKENEILKSKNKELKAIDQYSEVGNVKEAIRPVKLNELIGLVNNVVQISEQLNDIQNIRELGHVLQELKTFLTQLRLVFAKEKALTLNLQQFEHQYNDRKDNGDEPSV